MADTTGTSSALRRDRRATLVARGVLAALLVGVMAPSAGAGAGPAVGARSGMVGGDSDHSDWILVDDDHVVRFPEPEGEPDHGDRAARLSGPGFITFTWVDRHRPAYTFRLRSGPEIEQWRDEIQAAADEVAAATGGTFIVAPGTTNALDAGDGEILVEVSGTSPCGTLGGAGNPVGCGGPTGIGGIIVDGHVWLAPDLDTWSAHIGQATVSHEIGHALGLNHFDGDYLGLPQVMRSYVSDDGARSFRAGDLNGLVTLTPPAPPPNDDVADAVELTPDHGSLVGTTIGATRQTGEIPGTGETSVWYSYSTGASGILQVDLVGDLPVTPHLLTGSLGSFSEINPVDFVFDDGVHIAYPVQAATTYLLVVDGAETAFDLGWDSWPCDGTQFLDIPASHLFCTEITWLAGSGITTGFPDDTFRPVAPVTRGSMAAFLHRMAGTPAPPPGTSEFPDVPENHPFHDAIAWMVSEGITTGYGDGTFRPGETVRRQSMAAFLYRYVDSPDPSEWEDEQPFSDVGLSHPFHDAIGWLSLVRISPGYPDGTFRPTDFVTRQSMAAFLFRGVTDETL
jgi:hypothetical protein